MRFLIVDDDLAAHDFLRTALSTEGVADCAHCGSQAEDMFRRALEKGRPYDLLLIDDALPDMDGNLLLTTLRKLEREALFPQDRRAQVILLTSSWQQPRVPGHTDLGVALTIDRPKPVDENLLALAVRSLMHPQYDADELDDECVLPLVDSWSRE